MGVNRVCRTIMTKIVAEKYSDYMKQFEEHVVDFAHDYLLPTRGPDAVVTLSLYHILRDGTRIRVEAASFQRTDVNIYEGETLAYVSEELVICYKLAFQGADRRWDMRWSTPIDYIDGFRVDPKSRSAQQKKHVLDAILDIQKDMRDVLTNPREVLEERSDQEDSEMDLDSEYSDSGMTSMDSDDMLENQLDAASLDSEEEIEAMLDEAAALQHRDSDSD